MSLKAWMEKHYLLKTGDQLWFGVEELPPGVYLIVIQTKGQVITNRVIKKEN